MSEIINMFNELAESPDWKMVKFKVTPKKSNDWKSLAVGNSCPKVGDLLFAFHDNKKAGKRDHVAVYLGIHNNHKYVAEGYSVSGNKINDKDKHNVQISRIENSRLALDSDVITHFAHCIKYEVQQTDEAIKYNSLRLSKGKKKNFSMDVSYTPVAGEENMKHFTISELAYSQTAVKKKINNVPDQKQRQCLVDLVNYVLDPLYEKCKELGLGTLIVSSGFRNEETNKSIGGSATSQHSKGQAVDLQLNCKSGLKGENLLTLAKAVLTLESNSEFQYDQMIIEDVDSPDTLRPKWLHISFVKDGNRKYGSNPRPKLQYMYNKQYHEISKEEVLAT